MSFVPSLFNRPRLDTDLPAPPALAITGTLEDYAVGEAYSDRLQIENAIGKCTVVVVDSDMPAGSLVYVDNLTSEVVVMWPGFDLVATGLLQNGGFEEGSIGWSLTGPWEINNTGDAETGSYSAEFKKGVAGEFVMIGAPVPVTVPATIVINGRVQQGASSAKSAGAGVGLRWYGAGDTVLADTVGPMVESGSGGAWNTAGHSGSAPPGAVLVAPLVRGFRKRENKPLWVDNITWDHEYYAGDDSPDGYSLSIEVTDSAGRTALWSGTIDAIPDTPPFAIWSSVYKGSAISLSGDPLLVADSSTTNHVVLSDRVITGKCYWEITQSGEDGYSPSYLGIVGETAPSGTGRVYGSAFASVSDHIAMIATRDSFFRSALGTYGTTDTPANDTYRFAFDPATGNLWIGSVGLGGWFYGGDPATGSVPTTQVTPSDSYRACAQPRSVAQYCTVSANFGATAFLGAVPAGFASGIT